MARKAKLHFHCPPPLFDAPLCLPANWTHNGHRITRDPDAVTCTRCLARFADETAIQLGGGVECAKCFGSGRYQPNANVVDERCPVCRGLGRVVRKAHDLRKLRTHWRRGQQGDLPCKAIGPSRGLRMIADAGEPPTCKVCLSLWRLYEDRVPFSEGTKPGAGVVS